MTGALRLTYASTKQLLRARDVLVAALVVPLVILGILTLFGNLDFDTGQSSIGFTELMVTGVGVMVVTIGNTHAFVAEVADYKAAGVLKRIAVTPISMLSLIVGQVLPRIAIGVVFSVSYLTLAAVGTEINLDLAALLNLLPVLLIVAVTGLTWGFFVAGVTKTPMNANALDTFVLFWIMLFNGAMFPLDAYPSWLERAAEYLPYTGLIQATRGITIDGDLLTDFGPELAVSGAWLAVLFVVATRTYRVTK